MDVGFEEQKRFSLAHELGHIALHKAGPRVCYRTNPRSVRRLPHSHERQLEREADRFGTELLMPAKAVREQFRLRFERESMWSGCRLVSDALAENPKRRRFSRPDPPTVLQAAATLGSYCSRENSPTLAEYFGVSESAISFRLVELRLVY
jgi:Zn-dependent peptidase ImmA (M78 family)